MDDLEKAITEYMSECRSCTVATVGADGEPHASTVFFSGSGLDIYFNTAKDSRKVRDIETNPRVAITMQKNPDPKTDREISGIQYSGLARVVPESAYGSVPGGVMARHSAFNSVKPGNSVILKVTATSVYLIDYAKGFRHRDLLRVS